MSWKFWLGAVATSLAASSFTASVSADGYIVRTARGEALPNGVVIGSRGDYTIAVHSNLGFTGFATRERLSRPCAVEVEYVIGQDGGYDGGIERGEYGRFDIDRVLIDAPCKGRMMTLGVQEWAPVARLSSRLRLAIMDQIGVCTAPAVNRRRAPSIKGYRLRGFALRAGLDQQSDEHVRIECLNQGDGELAEWSYTGCGAGAIPTALYLHFAGDPASTTVDRLVGIEVGCGQVRIAHVTNVGFGYDELNGRYFTYDIRHIVGREDPVGGGSDRN